MITALSELFSGQACQRAGPLIGTSNNALKVWAMDGPDDEKIGTSAGQYVWYLASTLRRPPAGLRIFNVGAPISDAEYASHRSAVELLEQALAKSPFAAFQERCMEFMRAASDALEAFKAGQSTTPLTPVIRSRFDDVLSSFRRFTDHGRSKIV